MFYFLFEYQVFFIQHFTYLLPILYLPFHGNCWVILYILLNSVPYEALIGHNQEPITWSLHLHCILESTLSRIILLLETCFPRKHCSCGALHAAQILLHASRHFYFGDHNACVTTMDRNAITGTEARKVPGDTAEDQF